MWKVNGIGGLELDARGRGNVGVVSLVDGKEVKGTFQDVFYVPEFEVNLYSIGVATKTGLEVHFKAT